MTQVPGKSDEAQATPEYAVDVDDEVTNKFESVDATALENNLTLTPLNDAQEALVEKTIDLDLPSVSQGEFDTDESATIEGVPLLEMPKAQPAQPPESGALLEATSGESVVLEQTLGEQNGCVFYRARVGEDTPPFTAVWSAYPPPEPDWSHLPDVRVVRPRCRVDLGRAAIRVFDRPRGNTVIDYLGDGDRFLPAMATLELGIELAEMIENIHGAGYALYDIDPSQIVIGRGGKVRLYAINGIFQNGALPVGMLSPYAAPEVRRGLRYRIGSHSDVYAISFLLYALLARRAPTDGDSDVTIFRNPRVFRPECPLGIWPHLASCLKPDPKKRIGHARGLLEQLRKARERLLQEAAAVDAPPQISLEAWPEVHAGLGKARRGADQQDRAMAKTSESGTTGLYVIADGVSRSKYGDGAFAAHQVSTVAEQRWEALSKAGPAALNLNHAQRADVLAQVARSAGKKIALEVNNLHHPVPNEPNQVMSTTLVGAFVVDGEATIANLGDSRAYLIRDDTIERISIDHDRTTDALRMGLSYAEAADVRMGAALTRVVGRVLIDEDGNAKPDPFDPEVFRVRLMPNDVLVICSDGVADFAAGAGQPVPDQEEAILKCILEYEDPARAAFELVVLANRAGGYDNISCVVIAAHTL